MRSIVNYIFESVQRELKNDQKQLETDIKAALDHPNASLYYDLDTTDSKYLKCILLPVIPELLKAVEEGGNKIQLKGKYWVLIDYPDFVGDFCIEEIKGYEKVIPCFDPSISNHDYAKCVSYFKEHSKCAKAIMNGFKNFTNKSRHI